MYIYIIYVYIYIYCIYQYKRTPIYTKIMHKTMSMRYGSRVSFTEWFTLLSEPNDPQQAATRKGPAIDDPEDVALREGHESSDSTQ